jgi:RNA polymerase sigma-70 factor (ECF subfamily)
MNTDEHRKEMSAFPLCVHLCSSVVDSGERPSPSSFFRSAAIFLVLRSALCAYIVTMGHPPSGNSSETNRLLERVAAGDQEVWGELLTHHRERLRSMVALRLDRRLQGRIDASDVIQEAYVQASMQLADYLRNPTVPFYLWLRLVTGQRLVILHRHHLGTQARDAGREVALYSGALPEASSAALAAQLLGHESRPSEAAVRAEHSLRLQDALNSMDALDREVLVLRHFEQLSNAEAAHVLEIGESAASKRYVRALLRLKDILASMPGGLQELIP